MTHLFLVNTYINIYVDFQLSPFILVLEKVNCTLQNFAILFSILSSYSRYLQYSTIPTKQYKQTIRLQLCSSNFKLLLGEHLVGLACAVLGWLGGAGLIVMAGLEGLNWAAWLYELG
jgi:hypothetical protein